MKIRTKMSREHGELWPQEYMVDKVAEIPNTLFASYMMKPAAHYDFIEQNNVIPYQEDGIVHCLLVLCEGRMDGVLVQCDGYGSSGLTSYLPGARSMVQAKLDQAADFIVRQGMARTASGSWFVYCEELTEKFGLTTSKGSGLDAMLKDTLERRPEVEAVRMGSGAIETILHPEFCERLQGGAEVKKPDIRVRDILSLLTGGGVSDCSEDPRQFFFTHPEADTRVWPDHLRELTSAGREDHAALLDARVSEIYPSSEGLEVVLTGVEPEELARFNQAYDAFQQAEQAMGDMTP